ncbi:MAG: AzlD domain-containing protein [Rhizobium sp.]|nr:AzlD domain-containing protein [Rhizobium sp.]
MNLDHATLATIVAMMAATVFTRLSGALLVRRLKLGAAAEKALATVPPAVLMAVVAPTAFATGWPETIGCVVVVVAALRLSLLPAATLGVVSVALLRASGL